MIVRDVNVDRYLTVKITEGETHHITCPGFDCSMLVPVEIIEKLVSREMARRYLQFDIKANIYILHTGILHMCEEQLMIRNCARFVLK